MSDGDQKHSVQDGRGHEQTHEEIHTQRTQEKGCKSISYINVINRSDGLIVENDYWYKDKGLKSTGLFYPMKLDKNFII